MTTFVLVSGAWHGAWCWERVVPLLQREGDRSVAVELVGMGSDAGRPIPAPSLATWGRQVAEVARSAEGPVVLAGHSRGGVVISQAAEYAPESLAGLVYVTGMLVPMDASVMDVVVGASLASDLELDIDEAAGQSRVGPGADAIGYFYNTTEPAWAERAAGLLTPEPLDVIGATPELTGDRYGKVPRAYVFCEKDRALPPAAQRWMLERSPCDPVIPLATDHSPFYSAPGALADALRTAAAAFAGRRDV